MTERVQTTPGDILDLRYARSPGGSCQSAAMVVGENGEPTMLGPFPDLAPIRDLLMQRFPTRWPDRANTEMELIIMHFGRMKAGQSFAGFDYPEDGSRLP